MPRIPHSLGALLPALLTMAILALPALAQTHTLTIKNGEVRVDGRLQEPDQIPPSLEVNDVTVQLFEVNIRILGGLLAAYQMDGDRRWLDFQGAASVKATVDALKRRPPQGGTNMAGALKEAFEGFRDNGMDTIYLFSDGITDQFGGERKKKWSKKSFYNLLESLHNADANTVKERLESEISTWRGDVPQTDDILVIGITAEA